MTEPALPSEENNVKNSNRPEMPVMRLIKLFLRKWWVFAIAGLAAGIGGIWYAANEEPLFESKLTFSLDAGATEGNMSGAMNLMAQLGLGVGGGQNLFDGDNILEIMRSRRMIENVLLTSDTFEGKPVTLVGYYMQKSGLKNRLNKNERLKDVNFPVGSVKGNLSYLQDSILNNVYLSFSKEYISASRPDKKLSIFEVKVISLDEKFTKVFTDRLVNATSNFYTDITSRKDKETLEILENRVAALKGDVGETIDSRASTQDANVNPAFARAQSPMLKQQYNMQAYGEAYKEMFKTLEMARYQYLKKIPLLQIIDYADYPMKKIKIGKLRTGITFSMFAVLFTMLAICVHDWVKKKD